MKLAQTGAMSTALQAPTLRKKGFTLIEMVIVLAIIGTMLAVALPSVIAFMRVYYTRGADALLANGLQAARLKAVTKNVNLGVIFVVTSPTSFEWVVEDDLTPSQPDAICTTSWSTIPTECGGNFTLLLTDPIQANPFQGSGYQQSLPQGIAFADPGAVCKVAGGSMNEWALRFNRLGAACGVSTTCNATTSPAPPGGNPNPTAPKTPIYVNTATGTAVLCVQQATTGMFGTVTFSAGGRTVTQP